jgi:broad specificity phosphatase PhoE
MARRPVHFVQAISREGKMIFLVRHAEPEEAWGVHPDPGLSALGREQAELAARRLASLDLRACWSSPLRRCQETAAPFALASGLAVQADPAFGEIPTPAHVQDRRAWLQGVLEGRWSALGEDFTPWRASIVDALERLDEGTVVFTHFVAINVIVGALSAEDRVISFRPGHASITRLERIGGRLTVASLGDEGALKAL